MKLNEIEMTVLPDFRMFVGLDPDPTPAVSKVNKMNFRDHPFNAKMELMVAQAKRNLKFREAQVKPKKIPSHIAPKYNEEERGIGMFNARLEQWVIGDGDEWPMTFNTENEAQEWYRGLI